MLKRFETRMIAYLSHRPRLYALVVGIGVVLFWRGVWHTVDQLHAYYAFSHMNATIDLGLAPWWDGPISLLSGIIILYFTGAFISSFIGNELILSGLRGEKRLNEKTEEQMENEVRAISDIKESLQSVERTIEQLEKKVLEHHQAHK
jgi:hypothetical protein